MAAEAEIVEIAVKGFRSHPKAYGHKTRVAGVLYNLDKTLAAVAAVFPAADMAALHLSGTGVEETVLQFHNLFAQGGGNGNDFECRARFIGVGDSYVAPQFGGVFGETVGIVVGFAGQGENLPCLGLHDNNGGRPGLGLLHDPVQLPFHDLLDDKVDGQIQVMAFHGGHIAVAGIGNLPAAGVVLHYDAAGPAPQITVERQLNAVQALVVDTRKAHDMGGQIVMGILAPALLGDADARQAEDFDLFCRLSIDFALNPGKSLPLLQFFRQAAGIQT